MAASICVNIEAGHEVSNRAWNQSRRVGVTALVDSQAHIQQLFIHSSVAFIRATRSADSIDSSGPDMALYGRLSMIQ